MPKIIKNNIVYGPSSLMVELTQAEYNALSSAQKNNGTIYLITDSEPDSFSINTLSDVNISNPSSGQVLSYNGSKWKNDDVVKNKIGQSYIVCILAGANESGFRIQFPSNSRFTILVQDINGRVTSITKKTASDAVITNISGSYLATAVDSTDVYLRSGEWDIATFIISSFENVENITVASYT